MTLLGRLTVAFLLESIGLVALWLGMGLAAAAIVVVATGIRRPGRADLQAPAWAGAAGAMIAGSLAHRFEAAEPLLLTLGRREIPILWSLAGAAAGAIVFLAARRLRTA